MVNNSNIINKTTKWKKYLSALCSFNDSVYILFCLRYLETESRMSNLQLLLTTEALKLIHTVNRYVFDLAKCYNIFISGFDTLMIAT